jgi:hypothetical protein
LRALYSLINREIDCDEFGREISGMEVQWPKIVNFLGNLQFLAAAWMPHFIDLSIEQMEKLLK